MRAGSTASFLVVGMTMAVWALGHGAIATDWKDVPPGEEELAAFPLEKDLPGAPPESGIRYWETPFREIPALGDCYNMVRIVKDENGKSTYEFWSSSWDGDEIATHQITRRRGPSIDQLGPAVALCDGTIITDVPDIKDPSVPAPRRGFTRFSTILHDKEYGHVVMCCACADYLPGSTSLFPVLLTSKTGEPGSFTYLGRIKGEPAEIDAARKVWCDGGTLLRLKNGRWRMYLNGFGTMLAVIESDSLTGNWTFLRDEQGGVRELLTAFPGKDGRRGCFPHVLKVAEDNWHLWLTDQWPPQTIWHFWSVDGLSWQPYGQQPEITRKAFNHHGIKCMRAFVAEDGKTLVGLLSVYRDGFGWVLHESRMPAGPPPR